MKHLPKLVSLVTLVFASGCSGSPDEALDFDAPETLEEPSSELPSARELVDVPVRNADGSVTVRKGEIVDDWITLDGDILVAPRSELSNLKPMGSAMVDLDLRWPNNEMHFRFESDVPSAERDVIRLATKYWSLRSRVKFIEGQGNDTLVVESSDNGSWSYVGRLGGDQPFLWMSGSELDTAIHELGHALGLRHEHNRADRDSHIEVCWVNIHPDILPYYQIENEPVDFLTPYDSRSMMHYRRRAGHIGLYNGTPDLGTGTMRRINANPPEPGCFDPVVDANGDLLPGLDDFRADDVTAEDINAVNLMYGTSLSVDENGDRFGGSVLITNLDYSDGWAELAAGAPEEDVGAASNGGAVYLYRGTGRRPTPWRVITQETDWEAPDGSSAPALDQSEHRDAFGAALASGPLRQSGDVTTSWLAVGAPGEAIPDGRGANPTAGAVYVYEGQNEGVRPLHQLHPAQATGETNTATAKFGAALASADLDGDGKWEVLVGAPGKGTGRVYIYSGISLGTVITASHIQVIAPTGENSGVGFGSAITTGDFNRDGKIDIAIGAPRAGSQSSGRVFIYTGNGGTSFGQLSFTLWKTITGPTPVNGDEFGAALATLWLQNGNGDSLAVGAPNRTKDGTSVKTGAVYVYDHHLPSLMVLPQMKLETTRFPSTNQVQRYGAALAPLATDNFGFDKLVVTAPLADSGRGRAEILHAPNGPVNMQIHLSIASGTLGSNRGASVATGNLRHDGPNPLDPETGSSVQIVLGAPRSSNGLISDVGAMHGFHVTQSSVEHRFAYGQQTKMPWAL